MSKVKTNPFAKGPSTHRNPTSNATLEKKDASRENAKKQLLNSLEPRTDSSIEGIKFTAEQLSVEIEGLVYKSNGNVSQSKDYRDKIRKYELRIKGNRNSFIREILKKGVITAEAFCSLEDKVLNDDNHFKSLLGESDSNAKENSTMSGAKKNRTAKPPKIAFQIHPPMTMREHKPMNDITQNEEPQIEEHKEEEKSNKPNEEKTSSPVQDELSNHIDNNLLSNEHNVEGGISLSHVNEDVVTMSHSEISHSQNVEMVKEEKKEEKSEQQKEVKEEIKKSNNVNENKNVIKEQPVKVNQTSLAQQKLKKLQERMKQNKLRRSTTHHETSQDSNANIQDSQISNLSPKVVEDPKPIQTLPIKEVPIVPIKEEEPEKPISKKNPFLDEEPHIESPKPKEQEKKELTPIIPEKKEEVIVPPKIEEVKPKEEIINEIPKEVKKEEEKIIKPEEIKTEEKPEKIAIENNNEYYTSRFDNSISMISTGFKDKYKQLNEAKIELETKYEFKKKENEALYKEISSLKMTINDLREKTSNTNEEILQLELLKTKQILQSKNAEIEKMKEENSKLKSQLKSYEENFTLIKATNKQFREEAEKRFNLYQKEIESLRNRKTEIKETPRPNIQMDIYHEEIMLNSSNSEKETPNLNANCDFTNGITNPAQGELSHDENYLKMNGNIYDETKYDNITNTQPIQRNENLIEEKEEHKENIIKEEPIIDSNVNDNNIPQIENTHSNQIDMQNNIFGEDEDNKEDNVFEEQKEEKVEPIVEKPKQIFNPPKPKQVFNPPKPKNQQFKPKPQNVQPVQTNSNLFEQNDNQDDVDNIFSSNPQPQKQSEKKPEKSVSNKFIPKKKAKADLFSDFEQEFNDDIFNKDDNENLFESATGGKGSSIFD